MFPKNVFVYDLSVVPELKNLINNKSCELNKDMIKTLRISVYPEYFYDEIELSKCPIKVIIE